MAFVDDYTAWVTGPSEAANIPHIRDIVGEATEWAARSGARFEHEKTKVIHFTRNARLLCGDTIDIQGEAMKPQPTVKILGVVMDTKLLYREHLARAATRGLRAAMALQRLSMLSPPTARQLFTAAVAPVVDYASNVWAHQCRAGSIAALNRVQKIGASAITGTWRTVACAVAEAEANMPTVQMRQQIRATNFWTSLCTLPKTKPLARLGKTTVKRFLSPLQKMRIAQEKDMSQMEQIVPCPVAPWGERPRICAELDRDKAVAEANDNTEIVIATGTRVRNEKVGIGVAARDARTQGHNGATDRFAITVGARSDVNTYYAELIAVGAALERIPNSTTRRNITILTSNHAAVLAIGRPRQQSGQVHIRKIIKETQRIQKFKNTITIRWTPANEDVELMKAAKVQAKLATRPSSVPHAHYGLAKTTARDIIMGERKQQREIPASVGAYSKKLDAALPGGHTRKLYDDLKRNEARVLAQMRTGMARVNAYLHVIGHANTAMCNCGQAEETVAHYLFDCAQWGKEREEMMRGREEKSGSLSFFLGGKEPNDGDAWKPNMKAVRATIKFAIETKRLEYVPETT